MAPLMDRYGMGMHMGPGAMVCHSFYQLVSLIFFIINIYRVYLPRACMYQTAAF